MNQIAKAAAGLKAPLTLKKYIRIRSKPGARFVEFDFAINDPSLFVELIMPQDSFADFCAHNDVTEMTQSQMDAADREMAQWRYAEGTLMSDNHEL